MAFSNRSSSSALDTGLLSEGLRSGAEGCGSAARGPSGAEDTFAFPLFPARKFCAVEANICGVVSSFGSLVDLYRSLIVFNISSSVSLQLI